MGFLQLKLLSRIIDVIFFVPDHVHIWYIIDGECEHNG